MYKHKRKSSARIDSASSGRSSQASIQDSSEKNTPGADPSLKNPSGGNAAKSSQQRPPEISQSKGEKPASPMTSMQKNISTKEVNESIESTGQRAGIPSSHSMEKIKNSAIALEVKSGTDSKEKTAVKMDQSSDLEQKASPVSGQQRPETEIGNKLVKPSEPRLQQSQFSTGSETQQSRQSSSATTTLISSQLTVQENTDKPAQLESVKEEKQDEFDMFPMLEDSDLSVRKQGPREPKTRVKKQKRNKGAHSPPPPPPPPPLSSAAVSPASRSVNGEKEHEPSKSSQPSASLKALLYDDPNKYQATSKPIWTTSDLLNQKRNLKKVNLRSDADQVTLGRKELFDAVYEQRNEDPPDFIPLNLTKAVIVTQNITADLTNLQLSGLELVSDMFFGTLLGDRVKPVKKFYNLKKLHIVGCSNITDQGMKWIAELFPEISFIEMHGCTKVTEKGLHYLFTGCSNLHVCLSMVCSAAIIPDSVCQTMIPKGNITWAGNPVITEGKEYYISNHGATPEDFYDPRTRKLLIVRDSDLPFQVIPLLTGSTEAMQQTDFQFAGGIKVPSSNNSSFKFNALETSVDSPLVDTLLTDGSIVMFVFSSPATEVEMVPLAQRLVNRICSLLLQSSDVQFLLIDTGADENGKMYDLVINFITLSIDHLREKTYILFEAASGLDCLDFKGQRLLANGMAAVDDLLQLIHPDQVKERLVYQHGPRDKFSSWVIPVLSESVTIVQKIAPWVHCDYQTNVRDFLPQMPLRGVSTHVKVFSATDQSSAQQVRKRYSFPRLGSILKLISSFGEGLCLRNESRTFCSTDLMVYKSVCDLVLSQKPPQSVWVDFCQGNIPCWTIKTLGECLQTGGIQAQAIDCFNMLKRQGMLLRLRSQHYKGEDVEGSIFIRWQEVPEKHDVVDSLWPDARPKVRIIQSNRLFSLMPVAPSGFMPKVIRTLLKVFRPLLVWKTGFYIRQGPLDIKGELHKNSTSDDTLLLSARIIQLDMDAKFDDKADWRRSTDDTRKVMFAGVRQVVAAIEYACLKTKVYPHITLPCPKCAEFVTKGLLNMKTTWQRPYYIALSNRHRTCPKHKMINGHFLVNLAEEQGEGPSVPRHNYPYHVALSSFVHDMIKGTRYRPMDPPQRCFNCGADVEVPCLHCNMCSQCIKHFAKFAKVLQPGGVNSKSFKLSFGKTTDEKDEEKIKSNTKGCVFYYRKGHRMIMHYAMSPFYFDEINISMLKDAHCIIIFTLDSGKHMEYYVRTGQFINEKGEKHVDEMLRMRDTNTLCIKLKSVKLGCQIQLLFFVRGKEAYSVIVDSWDIKLDINCEKSGLYLIKAPGLKRVWQQNELERFAVNSMLEVKDDNGQVHPAIIVGRDANGNLQLDANGKELKCVSSSPQLYPFGATVASGGTLASDMPAEMSGEGKRRKVPVTAFLKFQVPDSWDSLVRNGLGINLPQNPDEFYNMYKEDPLLSQFISPCCDIIYPSVLNARQALLNDPIEDLLYLSGEDNYSLAAVLLLPAVLRKVDFTICSQKNCIENFKLHPLCYYRADVNSTMTVNPNARIGKYVECFHSLHMLDNEGFDLKELQDETYDAKGLEMLWAWIRMILRLQKGNLPHYSALVKGVDGIEQFNAKQIHDGFMSMLRMLGDSLFLSLGLETDILGRFKMTGTQRWADLNLAHADKQGLEKVQLKFQDEEVLMCNCHKEMWMLNQGLSSYILPKGMYLSFVLSLTLAGNALESVPPEMFTSMPSLQDLTLSENKLKSLPDEIANCQQLKTLTISLNLLTSLPDSLSQCREMGRLDIDKNRFTEFPKVITKLKKLTRLYAQHLHLRSLPDSIGELTELTSLSLNGNCFEDLPDGFGKLQKLTSLSLNGVVWLKSKHNVLLSRDHFEEFLNDNNLVHWLDRHNQDKQSIFSLFDEDTNGTLDPKEIGKLNATMFYVFPRFGYKGSKTPDEDTPHGFPKVLLQLKSLSYLSLQYQGLVSLPEEVSQLTSLSNLQLRNNPNLLTLPAQLGGLDLKRLELESCPLLKTPPKEIRARGFVTVYAYLKRLLSGSVSCKRTKLMLVGLGGAGKTSLVKALLSPKKKTELTIGEEITDGIDICPWTVPTPDGGEITYSVWDFAGQTVYYNTHQFFLSDRAVYFLMWNMRLGHEHAGLDFWLNSIRVHAPKAPIFIVGTHLDQVSKVELPMKEMQKRFPQICGFHFVSSHSGQGVQELQAHMTEVTLKQQYMGEKIPGVWLTFEENLKSIKDRSIIEFRELENRATRSGIFEASEIIQAVQFLHELGSIQYFTNANLKSHVVINPQWIVDMMACVVSVKDSPIKSGKFKHVDVEKVWKDYDPALHTWMLKLTEEFDLTFPLKDQPINLVPCLLPEKKPEFEWPESDKGYSRETKMVYKFDYLPAGLFNRSQVRLHQFSDSSLIWKRGSYLKKNKHICLLYQSRDSELTVKSIGPSPENILFLVHEVFESLIMESFKGINYDFSVPCPDCMKLSLKDPHMFPASIVRRATELKAPFLQCIKYFHTISITDIHAAMPPDSNQDFDLHLVQAVRGMKELQHDLAADIFVSYCLLDDKKPASENVPLGQICADVEQLGYRCWVPQSDKPQSLDEMAKALLDAKIFMVFMSNNYVKDETCCNLFKYARLTLRKPLVLVATGEDLAWKQSNMGILMADEVFINMMQVSRYKPKFEELKSMLEDKCSPTQIEKKKIIQPCFISYCWQNSAQAVAKGSRTTEGAVGFGDPRAIKDHLEAKGIRCWIDVERVGVHGLFEDIGEGLLKSRVVVVCMSDQYAVSENCSIEFRYAANTLKIPIILAVVGSGNKWRASELGIMSLHFPLVSFQEGSESSMGKLLELVHQHLPEGELQKMEELSIEKAKKDKDSKNVLLREKQQLSLQEVSELAQRKFLRQVNQYADIEQNVSYPGLMMVDFLAEDKGESESPSSNDGKEKSPDKSNLAAESTENQASPEAEGAIESARQSSGNKVTNSNHSDFYDQKFGVHLLCEHEEGWHKSGDAISFDKDFGHMLEQYLPYIARVSAIARYSQKLPLNCLALNVGRKYLHWMEENPIVTLTSDFHESFQALRGLVMSLDKEMKMGSLQRCQLPSGKSIWLCPKHRQLMRVTVLTKESVSKIQHSSQSIAVDQMVVAMREMNTVFLTSRFSDSEELMRVQPSTNAATPSPKSGSANDNEMSVKPQSEDAVDLKLTRHHSVPEDASKPRLPQRRQSQQDGQKRTATPPTNKERPLSRANSKSRACLLM